MMLWRFLDRSDASSPEAVDRGSCPSGWAERLNVPPLVADLLWRRGVRSLKEMNDFLSPGLRHLAPSRMWPGMTEAADVLEAGVRAGKEVLVWGDYDADGITGAALMLQVLSFHGVPARVHLPDRRSEGYGLNVPMLEKLAAETTPSETLLLTVDCGIGDAAAVARARELGFTVVVSDHHELPSKLPDAHALVDPLIGENPCPHLAGVGVAFFLMRELNDRLGKTSGKRMDMRETLDLVAIGTVADVVPLVGQNRILVKNGLLTVKEARRPGVAELKRASGFAPGAEVKSGQIAYNLAPRVNAAGRMGTPMTAFGMLLTDSHDEAAAAARALTIMNDERRAEEKRILKEALRQAEADGGRAGFVLYGEDWQQGVVGIVAGRVVEEFHRPTLALGAADGGIIKGSGRTAGGFDLVAGLNRCADLLLGYGGHKKAAGLSLSPDRLEDLRERFDAAAREEFGDEPPAPVLEIDAELPFVEASDFATFKGLEHLQPFGEGNPQPVFASGPLLVRKRATFGWDREHVKLQVTEIASGRTMWAKAWRKASKIPADVEGKRIRLAYAIGIDDYNGVASVELNVRDWELLPE